MTSHRVRLGDSDSAAIIPVIGVSVESWLLPRRLFSFRHSEKPGPGPGQSRSCHVNVPPPNWTGKCFKATPCNSQLQSRICTKTSLCCYRVSSRWTHNCISMLEVKTIFASRFADAEPSVAVFLEAWYPSNHINNIGVYCVRASLSNVGVDGLHNTKSHADWMHLVRQISSRRI